MRWLVCVTLAVFSAAVLGATTPLLTSVAAFELANWGAHGHVGHGPVPPRAVGAWAGEVERRAALLPKAPMIGEREGATGSGVKVTDCAQVNGVCWEVSDRQSLREVDEPTNEVVGRVVNCIWYPWGSVPGDWDDPNGPVPVKRLVKDRNYTVDCFHPGQTGSLTGYPSVRKFITNMSLEGTAVTAWDVADYAKGQISFDPPVAAIAPPNRQLVGTETWFAVTSRLQYPAKSAQAGRVWATVLPSFASVEWDFGELGSLSCTAHATRRWNPDLSGHQQHSNCTKVFTRVPGQGGRINARVTITWNIYWKSSNHAGWKYFGPHSASAQVPLNIIQLQPVIR